MIIARRCALILVVVGLVATQAACLYKRPEMELEAASACITDSKEACGDIYAPGAFNEAQRKLNEAYTAADNKEKGAKELALEAQRLATESKEEAARRGGDARAAAERSLSAADELLTELSASLNDLGDDEGTALFHDRLGTLRDTKARVESQLLGPGCDLLLAEETSRRLVTDAEALTNDALRTRGAMTLPAFLREVRQLAVGRRDRRRAGVRGLESTLLSGGLAAVFVEWLSGTSPFTRVELVDYCTDAAMAILDL